MEIILRATIKKDYPNLYDQLLRYRLIASKLMLEDIVDIRQIESIDDEIELDHEDLMELRRRYTIRCIQKRIKIENDERFKVNAKKEKFKIVRSDKPSRPPRFIK